jgi:cytochrome P450
VPKAFAGAVYQLLKHPDQRAELIANPELAQDAFWEALRTDMPTLMLGASAEVDTEICGGTKVRAGQKIMNLWASANRDEREFADPDRFDIHRRAPRIVSFNPGRHICLGIHVAQLEGRVMLQELLARIPDYEVDEDRAVRLRSEMFRGFQCLPITFRPH